MTGKKKSIAVAGLLLILLISVAAGFWLTRDGVTAEVDADAKVAAAEVGEEPDKLVRQTAPMYYSFDPAFTVNLSESDAVAQIGISVGTHFASTQEALKNDDPALRSAMLAILTDATQETVASDVGKQQILLRIRKAVNQQLVNDGYSGNVDGAFFTSVIVQGETDDEP